MELTRENLRVLLFFCYKEGGTAADAHKRVCAVFGEGACSPATARRWFSEWRTGSIRTTDLPHTGRIRSDDHAADIERMLEDLPFTSARCIASALGIDRRIVHRTLIEVLHRKYVCSKWVPHELTDTIRKQRASGACDLLAQLRGLGPIQADRVVTGDQSWIYLHNQPDGCWLPAGEARPSRARRTIADEKVMATVLFSCRRLLVVNFLPADQTFDSAT